MGGIIEMMERIEKGFVANPNLSSQEIKYHSFKLKKDEVLRAYIDYKDFRKTSDDKDTVADEVSFLSVFLSFTPKTKDRITIVENKLIFEVVDFRPNVSGSYDIFCKKDNFHTENSRYGGRRGF